MTARRVTPPGLPVTAIFAAVGVMARADDRTSRHYEGP